MMKKIDISKSENSFQCIIFLLLFSILACKTQHETDVIARYPDDTLRGVILENVINSRRACIVFYSQFGLITVVRSDEEIIQVRSFEDGSLIHSDITMGKGKNELMNYVVAKFNPVTNILFFVSPIGKSIKKYSIAPDEIELIDDFKLNADFIGFSSASVLYDSCFIFNTIFDGNYIAVYNRQGDCLAKVSQHLFGEEVNYNQRYHQPMIATNDKRGVIVTADYDVSYLAKYEFGNGQIKTIWSKYLIEPAYYIEAGLFYFRETHIRGFDWVELSDNRIFTLHDLQLYHDRSTQQHTYLLIFDYDGNMLNKYFLDYKIHSISIAPDGKTFYGVTEHPDVHIVRFQLP